MHPANVQVEESHWWFVINMFLLVNMVVSQFNGTSTPKGSYSAKTGDNDCNVNSSHYSLRTAMCESIRYQAKSEQNVRQDLIPTERHVEAALMNPPSKYVNISRLAIILLICWTAVLHPVKNEDPHACRGKHTWGQSQRKSNTLLWAIVASNGDSS